jgi:hypothetical protein
MVDPQNPDQALSGSETILLELPQPTVLHKGGTLRFGRTAIYILPQAMVVPLKYRKVRYTYMGKSYALT